MSFLPNNFNVVKMKYFVLSFIRLSKLPPVSFTKFLLLSSSFAFRIFYCMRRPKRKFAFVSFRRSFLQRRTLDMLLFWSNGWLRCFVFYHSPAMTKVKNVHVYQNFDNLPFPFSWTLSWTGSFTFTVLCCFSLHNFTSLAIFLVMI